MTQSPRFWELFFELYESLPRQGPGNRASAIQALSLCQDLPSAPAVLDLGCGVGAQTLYLAELTAGSIVAVDEHAPSIERLAAAIARHGLASRVRPMVADMAQLELPPASFDLIWSEGALYNLGIGRALGVCRTLLRPGGHLVFTDAVWRRPNPPPEVKASFDLDYPTMGSVADVLATIQGAGFELLGHFTLPDEAWWDDFYTPMEQRVQQLRRKHEEDAEAQEVLAQLAREPELHRQNASYYAYEFFVTRAPPR